MINNGKILFYFSNLQTVRKIKEKNKIMKIIIILLLKEEKRRKRGEREYQSNA